MNVTIRPFSKTDWNAISEIYRQGILTRNATFETEVPEYDTWLKKFNHDFIWVADINGEVCGWTGLRPASDRKVYSGVMEVTVYIDVRWAGKGIGTMLLKHLVAESEKGGIWTLYAAIFPENTSSIRLHQAAGFREVGFGKKSGNWMGNGEIRFFSREEVKSSVLTVNGLK